jgi:hypothetical protein
VRILTTHLTSADNDADNLLVALLGTDVQRRLPFVVLDGRIHAKVEVDPERKILVEHSEVVSRHVAVLVLDPVVTPLEGQKQIRQDVDDRLLVT